MLAACVLLLASPAFGQAGVKVEPIETPPAPGDPPPPESGGDEPGGPVAGEPGDADPGEATADDAEVPVSLLPGGVVAYGSFDVRYSQRQRGLDAIATDMPESALLDAAVELSLVDGVLEPSGVGGEAVSGTVAEVLGEARAISADATWEVARAIERYLAEEIGWLALVRAVVPGGAGGELTFLVEVDPGPYVIERFEIVFRHALDGNPSAAALLDIEVELGLIPGGDGLDAGLASVEEGYAAPRADLERVRVRLGDLPEGGPRSFYLSGLQVVVQAISRSIRGEGILGVLVLPHPEDFDHQWFEDIRESDDGAMRLLVYTGKVSAVRTIGFGKRLDRAGGERENNPLHARIVEKSPIGAGDLLLRRPLDRYLHRLNRMPGRRVDAAIGPGEDETASLDFLISERKPLVVYAQVSDTGTEQTDNVRYRFGLNWAQPMNKDDVLSFDYVTAGFEASHALLFSYESRLWDAERVRWRVDANWSEFTASDVGFAGSDFEGESYGAGFELIGNFIQRQDWFVDVFAGIRASNISVDNPAIGISESSDFVLPRVGFRVQRSARTASTYVSVLFEGNLPDVAGTGSENELNGLGRLFVNDRWVVLKWNARQSFFIEPLLNYERWSRLQSSLAHEVFLSFSGQHALGNRLIPQEQQVAGGLYSVRGYPESATSGDTVGVFTAEYRLHLTRLLDQGEPGELWGRPFRLRPQEPYGDPDWSLMIKGFVDAAHVVNSDRLAFESNDSLLSAGVGLEFSFWQSFSVRVDYGIALRGTDDDEVEAGDSELHFVATFLF